MTIETKDTSSHPEKPVVEVGTYQESFYQSIQSHNGEEPLFVVRKPPAVQSGWWRSMVSPLGVLIIAVILMIALFSFGLGASLTSHPKSVSAPVSSSSINMSNTSSVPTTNVPNATQEYGNQPAKYVVDPDGAKHFTFTAEQVMWEVVKGQRVL